jgi:predicted metal-dependent hydrolase
MAFIVLEGKKYSYQIVKKSISSIRLRLKSARSFIISCPHLTPKFIIDRFIKNNQNWIIQHSSKIHHQKLVKNLKKLTILDQDYQLIFIKTQSDSVVVYQEDKKIYANVAQITNLHIKKVLEKKLRPLALSLIKKELINLKKEFDFDYHHVTVRNQSSRFGSCSSRGNLNFNWQIVFFPIDKFRHILLHELNHLKIKNHSQIFWNQLTIYDSNCKFNNLWLKKQGTNHFLFTG